MIDEAFLQEVDEVVEKLRPVREETYRQVAAVCALMADGGASLRPFFTDPGVADAMEWAARAVRAFHSLPRQAFRDLGAAVVEPARAFSTAQLLLIELHGHVAPGGLPAHAVELPVAADRAARRGPQAGSQERAAELVTEAYQAARRGVTALAKLGVQLDLFPGETAEQRGARLLRYADNIRRASTEDTERIMQEAAAGALPPARIDDAEDTPKDGA